MAVEMIPRAPLGPGCGDACQSMLVFRPGMQGRMEMLVHDATTHEAYGMALAGGADPETMRLTTGPLVVDLLAATVYVDGEQLRLTATETKVMLCLARRTGRLTTLQTLMAEVWGYEYETEGTARANAHMIRVTLARLRSKLGQACGLIVTRSTLGLLLLRVPPGEPAPAWVPSPHAGARRSSFLAGRWSLAHDKCRGCGTTARSHDGRGYCTRCYSRVIKRGLPPGDVAP